MSFDVALYFFFCYIFAAPTAVLVSLLAARKVNVAFKRRLCHLGAFCILLLPLLPYAQVELQTRAYAEAMCPVIQSILEKENSCKSPILALKVLSMEADHATVFVVWVRTDPKPLCARGETLSLQKASHGWRLLEYETVWSDCGSASGGSG